ncbi:Uncharacterised protein [Oligella ureolytica]|nr:Uncharacterised protein [Oligella ureolytica]
MTSNNTMTGEELGQKLLTSIKQMKSGQGTVVYSPVAEAQAASGFSQSEFAALM